MYRLLQQGLNTYANITYSISLGVLYDNVYRDVVELHKRVSFVFLKQTSSKYLPTSLQLGTVLPR